MQQFTDVVLDTSGNVVAGASVYVYTFGTTTTATIYSDDGSTVTANPLTTSATGTFSFYAADNKYTLHIVSGASTADRNIWMFDPYTANTTDTDITGRVISATVELKTPTSAPASPVAGDIWQTGGVTKFGASSLTLASLSANQTWTGQQSFAGAELKVPTSVPGTPAAGHIWEDTGVLKHGASSKVIADLSTAQAFSAAQTFSSTLNTLDGSFNLKNTSDPTKIVNFSASGLTTATTRTLTVPDADGTIGLTTSPGTAGTDVSWTATGQLRIPSASDTARGLVTTSSQTIAGDKTLTGATVVSGTLTPSGGLIVTGRGKFATVPIGPTAYGTLGTSTTPVTGTIYIAEVFLPRNMTIKGIGVLNAATVGTNKYVVGLYASAGGAVLANSALAGTTTSGADAFQEIDFTGTYDAVGPARYWIAVQLDGTTDRFRTVATATYIDVLTKSFVGAFGTLASLTVPTTFTADVGPIAYIYTA